ncbi:2-oxoglutarate dehydrogenase E1 component [hydrothermal vent metagenome]|uniref:oxoglutarate dehydrogenase (succinyl-transferring) n=1 Tax=hydrothermal vent metagenome TaxID=652676 RepID=A0A3B1DAV5_9ZZZZ
MNTPPRALPAAINGWNAEYLDGVYEDYVRDPESVSAEMRAFFRGFDLARADGAGPASSAAHGTASHFQVGVDSLIATYRRLGHIAATLDPFGRERKKPAALAPAFHGLSPEDLELQADVETVRGLQSNATVATLIEHLERTYCGSAALEFMHIESVEERQWWLDRFECGCGKIELSRGEQAHVMRQLLLSEQFERFLAKRYPGDKRFSLEGAESIIALLDRLIEGAANLGVEEVVIGMAHRGRLNVLNNIIGKTYAQIFTEFEENWDADFVDGGGDVKYHRGYSGTRQFGNGKMIHLALASNPSHLEAVGAVVEGRCRAKQRLQGDTERRHVIPVIIHGDAAIAGQGIVAEMANFSQLEGYTTGGTVHVVVNNMIGFTTVPEDSRSSRYCTDIAKMINAPVIHVNGEDPEAVVAAAQMAIEYRQKFRRDIFVDMWCYRRYGHNEQDEASFTQPVMAGLIKRKPSTLKVYAERLFSLGVLDDSDMTMIRKKLDESLDHAQDAAKASPYDPTIDPGSARWTGVDRSYKFDPVETAVSREMLEEVCKGLARVPESFKVNPKLQRLLDARAALLETKDISYADAESLAFGTLLLEGTPIRLSGQDSRRGTFSHRHAVLRDFETGEPCTPLNQMRPLWEPHKGPFEPGIQQARLCVYDSPLSEASVLGFDYGYSLADPNMLVLWEAQFGDFVNGAQVIIDQFLASAELKWERWSGLVMLLPHGYEGAGPEHSSARIERFLELCANDNMQVIYPSTGPQIFHALRRQLRRNFRKPLIVCTPKSMLRVPTGTIDELMTGHFREFLDDPRFVAGGDRSKVRQVTLCSGKFYHELAARRDHIGRDDVALVRVEQFYPFHAELCKEIIGRYPENAQLVYAQEEPRNAGGALFVLDCLRDRLGLNARYLGRPTNATPAVGSKRVHKQEQQGLLDTVIGAVSCPIDAKPSTVAHASHA